MAMLLYSLIVLWFAKAGHSLHRREILPWYRHKLHASFEDMLATLRAAGVRQTVLSTGLQGQGSRKVLRTILHAYRMAA